MSDLNENQLKKYSNILSKVFVIQGNEVKQDNNDIYESINIHDFIDKLFS